MTSLTPTDVSANTLRNISQIYITFSIIYITLINPLLKIYYNKYYRVFFVFFYRGVSRLSVAKIILSATKLSELRRWKREAISYLKGVYLS